VQAALEASAADSSANTEPGPAVEDVRHLSCVTLCEPPPGKHAADPPQDHEDVDRSSVSKGAFHPSRTHVCLRQPCVLRPSMELHEDHRAEAAPASMRTPASIPT
jgi:hypothetical protein